MSESMPIAQGHAEEGEQLVNPPAAVVKPIEQALRSPLKQRVSVAGRILQEEGIRTVYVKGTDVNIRNIVIQDVSGKAKVCLWRDASNADARTGQYVKVTDVVVNNYKGELSLSTTQKACVIVSNTYLFLAFIKFSSSNALAKK
ncbi:DNA-directed RNA polymerase I complex subunit Rpa2 [Mactra antiquata]